MMLTNILLLSVYLSLLIHIVLIALAVWRVWRGENVVDRLIAVDLVVHYSWPFWSYWR
ncbi:MAG: hypothetical protein IPM39_07880 [Chloroflexi bacterium]|nr:hypothetical protein [Chloroflexota bacterium]